MDINTHDLLKLHNIGNLITNNTPPDWVNTALEKAPFVVVRRDFSVKGLLPIGIRGSSRSERYGCFIAAEDVAEQVTPEQLAAQKAWRQKVSYDFMRKSMDAVDCIFADYKLAWGPVGSVGFELASGYHTIKKTSDLDLIIRSEKMVSIELAQKLVTELAHVSVKMDVQIETKEGAISLFEYARDEGMFLMRTKSGPRLVKTSPEIKVM
jgi:phosphoribosyl-dephospho-CoA transferase